MVYIDNKTFEILDKEYYKKGSNKEEYDYSHTFECDDLIAQTVSILNKKGYFTEHCCQGHFTNYIHDESEENIDGIDYVAALSTIPYIGFKSCVSDINVDKLKYWKKEFSAERLVVRCKMYNELGCMHAEKEYFESIGEAYKVSIILKDKYWNISVDPAICGKEGWIKGHAELLKYHKELLNWAEKLSEYCK